MPLTMTAEQLRAETLAQTEALKLALRREMRRRDLRQRDLARQLGYSDSYLANLLGNVKGREPAGLRVDTFLALARLVEASPLDLLAEVLAVPAPEQARASLRTRAAILDLAAVFDLAEGLPESKVEELARSTMRLVGEMMRLLAEREERSAAEAAD